MALYVTYCSKEKSSEEKEIPAICRYSSSRIQKIFEKSNTKGHHFAILSGKYGLIEPEKEIPYYDKLLMQDEVGKMIPKVRDQLQELQASKVVYFTKEIENQRIPYFKLVKKACQKENIEFEKKIIE
ncbi:DUF6884 domain-containing protein [Candidatus Nanohalovita haloferacivicina]|uniref:DUF6884 domain-containing protein n=1 Tax=Candidatus Nanohalovita haloferacivicina TaxID=2978046 RepID=UPI00325FB3B3|nr:hypothetical protein HBNXNv_0861 [Candidatus Nanohalobia archaeon BNXNv]